MQSSSSNHSNTSRHSFADGALTFKQTNSNYIAKSRSQTGTKVRLRARNVVCNRCKQVCAESGNNVEHAATTQKIPKNANFGERCVFTRTGRKRYSMVPLLKRLDPEEIKRNTKEPDKD